MSTSDWCGSSSVVARVSCVRSLQSVTVVQLTSTGHWERCVRQRRHQTRVSKVRLHVTANGCPEEPLQRQDVT